MNIDSRVFVKWFLFVRRVQCTLQVGIFHEYFFFSQRESVFIGRFTALSFYRFIEYFVCLPRFFHASRLVFYSRAKVVRIDTGRTNFHVTDEVSHGVSIVQCLHAEPVLQSANWVDTAISIQNCEKIA